MTEIALVGGRVIDPESGLDAVRTVAIDDGLIEAVTADHVRAERVVDVTGLVIAPGFIDLHSHAQTLAGARLQAMDGVTTALELESGSLPLDATYAAAEREGRPINFGFSAGWAHARLAVVAGLEPSDHAGETPIEFFEEAQAHPRWNTVASEDDLGRILTLIEHGLDRGGIGIGVLLGYAPLSDRGEFRAVATLAARRGVPVFVHSRTISMQDPGSSLEGARELIEVAEATGAHLHICHLNSTSLRLIETIGREVRAARRRGVAVTTEAYPYGAGSTGIGADFFAPERLERLGVPVTAITYLPTGERVASLERLAELRRIDPGGLCVFDFLDLGDPGDFRLLRESLALEGGVIASDAMPLTIRSGRRITGEWPVPDEAMTHPRSAGTFARTLRWLVRETGVFALGEALERMSLAPARILETSVPAMRNKGRLRPGADADLVVFDPATVTDEATFERLAPSSGIVHVLVGGRFVVADGELDVASNPGRAVRAGS